MPDSQPPSDHDPKRHIDERTRAIDETRILNDDTASTDTRRFEIEANHYVGRHFGKYQITGVLGKGGMGIVLRARDTTIDRDVALKLLPRSLATNEVALRRFLVEAKATGRLNHPNTVTIHEIDHVDDDYFIVMELVEGGSVSDDLEERGALSIGDATRIIIQACRGLKVAHDQGLIHRDVKPANLLKASDGTIKVSDFGLAKRSQDESLSMTQDGQIVGTPYYMSPEQCEAADVDLRSDIYSLGATYFSLLVNRKPYEDKGSAMQVMFSHCNAPPPNPVEVDPGIPQACAAVIAKAMATKPEDRYSSVEDMSRDLEAIDAALSGSHIQLPSQPRPKVVEGTGNEPWIVQKWPLVLGLAALAIVLPIGLWILSNGLNRQSEGESGRRDAAGEGPAGTGTADEGNSSPGSSAAVSPSMPMGEPIKIGVLHSLSGTMASSESPVVDATLMAIQEINEQGGLLGRPVEALVRDGRSRPEIFAEEAEKLIVDDRVATVFGCWTSASRRTVVPIFEEQHSLLLYPVQYEGIESSRNVIYLGAAPNQQILPALKWAYAFQNKRRFYFVGSDYVFPRVAHEIVRDELETLGAELVGSSFLPLGSSDVKAMIEDIKAKKPDVILNAINGDSNTPFFSELRKSGIQPSDVPTISFSIGEEQMRHLDVSMMAGDYAAWTYFQNIDNELNAEFVEKFRAKYGPQRLLTDPMQASYVGVKLWAQAVEAAQSTDPEAIRDQMHGLAYAAPEGEVQIDAETQHAAKTPRIGRVMEDGQYEIVWTAANPESPEPYPGTRSVEEWNELIDRLYRDWGQQWAAPN